MSKYEKFLSRLLWSRSEHAVPFADLCSLLSKLGFQVRIKGSHHIFYKKGVDEIVNLQPVGRYAKPYQVKQVRSLITKYKMGGSKSG